jgi:hypothetical protein
LQKLFLCANKISRIENVSHLKNLTLLELGDNKIRASGSQFGITACFFHPRPEHYRCQVLWYVPDDVGFMCNGANVLSVTLKGTSCDLGLLTLPLLKLVCVPELYNLLVTNWEGSHFGDHIGTYHATFKVEKFWSLKPIQICTQIFLLERVNVRHRKR